MLFSVHPIRKDLVPAISFLIIVFKGRRISHGEGKGRLPQEFYLLASLIVSALSEQSSFVLERQALTVNGSLSKDLGPSKFKCGINHAILWRQLRDHTLDGCVGEASLRSHLTRLEEHRWGQSRLHIQWSPWLLRQRSTPSPPEEGRTYTQ